MISVQIGSTVTTLTVDGALSIQSADANFHIRGTENEGFAVNVPYTILTSTSLADYTAEQFNGISIKGIESSFSIVGNEL